MELTITYYGRRIDDGKSVTASRSKGSMLGGSEENEFPYFESDASEILHKLLEKGLIELL